MTMNRKGLSKDADILSAIQDGLKDGGSETVGNKDDSPITDPALPASICARLAGIESRMDELLGPSSLSSEFDTIDVNKMSKGAVTVAHNAIIATATSSEIDCRGFNALDIQFEVTAGSGKWDIETTGAAISGGTFKSQFVGSTKAKRLGLTANTGFILPISMNYCKIVATEIDNGATVTIRVTPLNLASIPLLPYIRETQISTDQTVTWAASAVVNTQKNIDFTKPDVSCEVYQAICMNPSRVSDVAVDAKTIETSFNSETRRIQLASFNVPAATALLLFNDESAPFVTAQGANVTCSTDAVTYKVGTKSAKLAVGAGATTGLLASVATTGTYNLSIYSHLWFWVYSSIALAAGDLTMSVDDTAACASPIETISIPAIAATTWTKLYIPMLDPTLCTAIISAGINMAVDKGAFDIYFDDVSAFKPGSAAVLISGLFNGVGARFSLQNSTALGATNDFSAYLRLKEYK